MAALARVERTDFLSPMCIGEVAHVSAEITYTSKHSVEVQVNVLSENILTGNFWVLLTKPPASAWPSDSCHSQGDCGHQGGSARAASCLGRGGGAWGYPPSAPYCPCSVLSVA